MDDAPSPPRRRCHWTAQRAARLGLLVGLGWDAPRIAADPLIVSTSNNVHRQAQRLGIGFREVATAGLRLPPAAAAAYDLAAKKRGLTRETLIRLLLTVAVEDPALLDNILDDEV